MKNRVGEVYTTNEGYKITIIECFNSKNCTIQFEDGVILKNRSFGDIKRGQIKNFNHHVGEVYLTTEGYEARILEYNGGENCTIILNDGNILYNKNYTSIKKGNIKNPYHRSLYGVGYMGVGKYNSKNNLKCYESWARMFIRCYNKNYHKNQATYIGCSVDEKWHNFQNFGAWFEDNYNLEFMEKWQLDKDILIKGNKVYSAETCCFVPAEINSLFTKRQKCRGKYPIGVTKVGNRFSASLYKSNRNCSFKTYNIPEKAFEVYKVEKEKYIKEVADKWKDQVSEKIYQVMYKYEVEITD